MNIRGTCQHGGTAEEMCDLCCEAERRAKLRYVATAADRCGEFYESPESDFRTAVAAAVVKQTKRPDAFVMVVNLDEVDLGRPDGLTEDEREEVDAALIPIARQK
jgi:hypothetical protein